MRFLLKRRVTMNLWDSVHRGLEKASQEAARIAKIQRLRGNIDNLSRQIHTHHDNLLRKVLDLFSAGQLTQSELIPLCQELASLQQQLHMFQQELKQLQNLGTPSVQPAQPAAPIAPHPPEYHAYSESTVPVQPPPP